jgi:multimeric flavodoxin WrbA
LHEKLTEFGQFPAKKRHMKILGIAGSTRKPEKSGVYKLVETVLANSGCDCELVHLKGKTISGRIACLGCVKDNVCKVEDDLPPLRQAVVDADAYVIGAPHYYSGLNATTHAFLERWFQYRHQAGNTLWGKLAVGVGGTAGQFPA